MGKMQSIRALVGRKLKSVKHISRNQIRAELKKCRKLMDVDWKRCMDNHVKNILRKYSKGDIEKELNKMKITVSWKADMLPYYNELKKRAKAKISGVKKKAGGIAKSAAKRAVKKAVKRAVKKRIVTRNAKKAMRQLAKRAAKKGMKKTVRKAVKKVKGKK